MKPLNQVLTEHEEGLMEEMSVILYRLDKDPKSVNHWRYEDIKAEISGTENSGLIYKLAREKANSMFKSRKRKR
jgi:hypothetical protein